MTRAATGLPRLTFRGCHEETTRACPYFKRIYLRAFGVRYAGSQAAAESCAWASQWGSEPWPMNGEEVIREEKRSLCRPWIAIEHAPLSA
jgi:hypothetical protein